LVKSELKKEVSEGSLPNQLRWERIMLETHNPKIWRSWKKFEALKKSQPSKVINEVEDVLIETIGLGLVYRK